MLYSSAENKYKNILILFLKGRVFLTDLLTSVSDVIDAVFNTMLPDVFTAITGSPILTLFVVCVPLVGIAIGIFNRLVKAN